MVGFLEPTFRLECEGTLEVCRVKASRKRIRGDNCLVFDVSDTRFPYSGFTYPGWQHATIDSVSSLRNDSWKSKWKRRINSKAFKDHCAKVSQCACGRIIDLAVGPESTPDLFLEGFQRVGRVQQVIRDTGESRRSSLATCKDKIRSMRRYLDIGYPILISMFKNPCEKVLAVCFLFDAPRTFVRTFPHA